MSFQLIDCYSQNFIQIGKFYDHDKISSWVRNTSQFNNSGRQYTAQTKYKQRATQKAEFVSDFTKKLSLVVMIFSFHKKLWTYFA